MQPPSGINVRPQLPDRPLLNRVSGPAFVAGSSPQVTLQACRRDASGKTTLISMTYEGTSISEIDSSCRALQLLSFSLGSRYRLICKAFSSRDDMN